MSTSAGRHRHRCVPPSFSFTWGRQNRAVRALRGNDLRFSGLARRACPAMPSTACYLTVPPCGVRWINQTPSAAREGRGEPFPSLGNYRRDLLRTPLERRQHLIDDAVLLRVGSREEFVALDVPPDELLVPA